MNDCLDSRIDGHRYFIVVFVISTVILCLMPLGRATILEGEINTIEDWTFLARFCFLKKNGWFSYEVSYPKEFEVENILLYYDARSQWPSVYKKNKPCRAKEAVLSARNNQIINLTSSFPGSGCHEKVIYDYDFKSDTRNNLPPGLESIPSDSPLEKDTIPTLSNDTSLQSKTRESNPLNRNRAQDRATTVIFCKANRTFASQRERWWYIALANCDSRKGLRLKYRIVMTNDMTHGSWIKHFSADQLYVLHTDVAFCGVYYLLFLASSFTANALHSRHLLHETYKLYMVSVLLEASGLTLLTTYYSIYAQYGTASQALKFIGKGLEALSILVFLLLLILIAKGYTVTRARLKHKTSVKIGIFMGIYSLIYAILFVWEKSVFDPGEVLYVYESPAGYGLIILRLSGWIWFVYSLVFTLMNYPTKSVFFTRIFLFYTIWFISSPVVVLISSLAVPKWMRENIINGVELFITFEAHLVFYLLTQPSKANKNFPFHVRTTQIGVMDKEKETGDGTLDRFTSYPYAPTNNSHNIIINSVSEQQQQANNIMSSQPNIPGNGHHIHNGADHTNLLKRHQTNIGLAAASFAFPPGFIVDGNNSSETELSLNNRRNKESLGWTTSPNDYTNQQSNQNTENIASNQEEKQESKNLQVDLKKIKPDKDL